MTIAYHRSDPIEELLARHADGVKAVVDMIHQFDALMASARAVARGGRLVSTLLGPDPSAFPAGIEVRYIRLSPSAGDLRMLVEAVAHGRLTPNVTRTPPFAKAPRAYAILGSEHVQGKVVVVQPAD